MILLIYILSILCDPTAGNLCSFPKTRIESGVEAGLEEQS